MFKSGHVVQYVWVCLSCRILIGLFMRRGSFVPPVKYYRGKEHSITEVPKSPQIFVEALSKRQRKNWSCSPSCSGVNRSLVEWISLISSRCPEFRSTWGTCADLNSSILTANRAFAHVTAIVLIKLMLFSEKGGIYTSLKYYRGKEHSITEVPKSPRRFIEALCSCRPEIGALGLLVLE